MDKKISIPEAIVILNKWKKIYEELNEISDELPSPEYDGIKKMMFTVGLHLHSISHEFRKKVRKIFNDDKNEE